MLNSYTRYDFLLNSPLEQFEILPIFSFGINNTVLFIIFGFCILGFLLNGFQRSNIMFNLNVWYQLCIIIIEQVSILVMRNLGVVTGQYYLTWLLFCFLVIGCFNLLGIIPYAFTVTSHIIITFNLAFILFIGINIKAILVQKLQFLQIFLPGGAPFLIMPFLILIELISYVARVFSLSIRLFANIMAGHTLLKILIGFTFLLMFEVPQFGWLSIIVGSIVFLLVYIITFLEIAIAILQAYVFTVLMCLYVRDLHVAH